MANPYERVCVTCERRPVEVIDDWVSTQCSRCNDRSIERADERREWDHYHGSR